MDPGLRYSYIKQRKDFGRQPMFCEAPVVLLDSINPDISLQKEYCLRNPVNRESQTSTNWREDYVNTKVITSRDQGINHEEGGWPEDINYNDEEATARYRRRFERNDSYVDTVLSLYPQLDHLINQNNAIEMYNMYFKDMKSENPVEKFSIRVNASYKDQNKRPIADICWTCEGNSKLVTAYGDKSYPDKGPINKDFTCFVWSIENPKEPCDEFKPPSACWQVACSPVNNEVIYGGLEDGRVCIFDIRENKDPVSVSSFYWAHRDPISALTFMHSRINTEFFSGSSDGKCLWWDIRNISRPIDELIMAVRAAPNERTSLASSEGVSALQFDRALPTKFLCGTDTGFVISVNRKGKRHEEVMSAVFNAHNGAVKAVHRSPCTTKVFITCGDWRVNIWSEDIHSAPIIPGMAQRKQITDVVWSPHRVSGYMSVSQDGKFRYWDILRKPSNPIVVWPISKYPLLKIKPNEEGQYVAIGDNKGTMYLVLLSNSLVWSEERDKQLMLQCFERETRRERIIETRVKEIRLKLKEEHVSTSTADLIDEDIAIRRAEDEYRRIVAEEFRKFG